MAVVPCSLSYAFFSPSKITRDARTYGRTDGRTDTTSHRDATAHQKMLSSLPQWDVSNPHLRSQFPPLSPPPTTVVLKSFNHTG